MKLLRLVPVVLLVLLAILPPPAGANSAEPPGLTVLVTLPPEELTLSLRLPGGDSPLRMERTAWEGQYRLYYGATPQTTGLGTVEGGVLIAEWEGGRLELPLPSELTARYQNIVTLHLAEGQLTTGQTAGRLAATVGLRVGLTLLIEGLIFFLFGYRSKRSWIAFLAVNLLTQGALNLALNRSAGGYLMMGLLFYELLVLIVELSAFRLTLTEHRPRRMAAYTVTANLASLLLGGFLLTRLPL